MVSERVWTTGLALIGLGTLVIVAVHEPQGAIAGMVLLLIGAVLVSQPLRSGR